MEAKKIASKNGIEDKARAVLEILSNSPLTGEDIANQCSFESRMTAAGTIAKLVRTKAIEQVPSSYRITETGRSILSTNGEEPKKKRRSKKEPQEPVSQGEQSL